MSQRMFYNTSQGYNMSQGMFHTVWDMCTNKDSLRSVDDYQLQHLLSPILTQVYFLHLDELSVTVSSNFFIIPFKEFKR
ncbi:hypothetical protein TNCV_2315251 [Trichonephila clavipes]|nr:hypothetical protein TNCV_2315251 [Trichonephila clavipes]